MAIAFLDKLIIKTILFITIILCRADGSAQSVSYYRDFDYSKMQGIDKLNENSLPAFYVKCGYDKKNVLTGVGTMEKGDWMAYHIGGYLFPVIHKENKTLIFLGAGKERDGYTRGLFQKKIYRSDTALITGDTLIFKQRWGNDYIRVQLFTKINTDKPEMKELAHMRKDRNDEAYLSLSDIGNYSAWFKLDSLVEEITIANINLKEEQLLAWQNIKHGEGYLQEYRDYTKQQYNENASTRPVSLFWLKFSGCMH